MSENIRLSLEPSTVQLEPGGEPTSTVLTVQNMGQVVDQYAIQVEGLDPSWYTVPVTGVALFPQDRNEVRLSIHPPKRSEAKAGDYPFTIKVSSRAAPGEWSSSSGVVKIQPLAVFKAEMSPQRARCRRKATFRLALANSGNTDLALKLSAADREEGCQFTFHDDEPEIPPNEKRDLSLTVRPRRSWLIGKSKSYDFTVSVAPQEGRGDAKVLNGYLVHKPLLESWRPIWSFLKTIVILTLLLLGVSSALYLGGGVRGWQSAARGLWERGKSVVQPILSGRLPSGQGTALEMGFKETRDAAPEIIGEPVEGEWSDKAGNVYQNTNKGTLFWYKASNTVYFIESKGAHVFRDGKLQRIDRTR